MRRELARLLVERPRTVVLVTHDIEEACQLATAYWSERAPGPHSSGGSSRRAPPARPTHPQVVEAVENLLGLLGLRDEALSGRTASETRSSGDDATFNAFGPMNKRNETTMLHTKMNRRAALGSSCHTDDRIAARARRRLQLRKTAALRDRHD
jgi:hypothetical protein